MLLQCWLPSAHAVLRALFGVTHLILTTALQGGHRCHCHYFADGGPSQLWPPLPVAVLPSALALFSFLAVGAVVVLGVSGDVTVAGRTPMAGCPWALRSHMETGSRGRCHRAPCVSPPGPALAPPAGVWRSPGLPGRQWGAGGCPASGRCGPAWHAGLFKVLQTAAGPRPRPFFSLLSVEALLIWEQGPFMWRWAWPGLPVPPKPGDFLFIWCEEPRAPSETADGLWWCHKTWVTQLSVGHCGPAALLF